MRQICVRNKIIGDRKPPFIIAEVASNHMGNINTALKTIDAAVVAGADAVKFQMFSAENFIIPSHSRYEISKKIEFTSEDWFKISEHSAKKDILLIVDVLDELSADVVKSLKMDAFKIHTTDVTNPYLMSMVGRMGKPIFLATGSITLGEIEYAVNVLKSTENENIVLMHGYNDYPTPIEELNLLVIPTLKNVFHLPVGFLDHTLDIYSIPLMAVAVGANVIEKHITLNRGAKGYDWQVSLEPNEFKAMVTTIRKMRKALGSGLRKPSRSEMKWRPILIKKIVTKKEISKGEEITMDKIAFKRAGGEGLHPFFAEMICSRKAKTNISKNEVVTWKKVL